MRGKIEKAGAPRGLTGDLLNRGISPAEDAVHELRGLLSYEWWYFDAAFDNGYSAVAIVWPMNYSRPWRRQCTVQLSLYGPDGASAKHYVFPPARLFCASSDHCEARVEGIGHVRSDGRRYEVRLEIGGEAVDLEFEPVIPGWRPGTGETLLPFPRYRSMGWLVPVPLARVRGTVRLEGKTVEVEGYGYHDHNWGEAPIFRLVDNWHWGHLVQGNLCVIWADITFSRSLAYDRTRMFLLASETRLVMESAEISVEYGDWRREERFMHPYPRRITLAFGDGESPARGGLVMQVLEVIETQDLLEMTGLPRPVRRAVNRLVAKPYYFRWLSSVEGFIEIGEESTTVAGRTIHEQMLLHSRDPVAASRGLHHR